MIRPFTLITAVLAAGSGAYLFAVKHRAQVLDNQLATVAQASRLDAQRIRVLQAQWALETDPTRLQRLAAQFTELQPMRPEQLMTLAALKSSLPAPGSAVPGGNPALPDMAQPGVVADASPQAGADALPVPPPPAPAVAVATEESAARPAGVPRAGHAGLPPSELAAAYAPASPAAAGPASRPRRHAPERSAARVAEAPERSAARVAEAPERSAAPSGRGEARAVRSPTMVAQYVPAPALPSSGSMLGIAADLPPPKPLPQNGTGN